MKLKSFLKSICIGYPVIAYKYCMNQKVSLSEYRTGYDRAAVTYERWLWLMGKNTDKILNEKTIPIQENAVIVDLCCGTGYVTRKVDSFFLKKNIKNYTINSCDLSEQMLTEASVYNSPHINYIVDDAIVFLKSLEADSVDALYCAWAIYYCNHAALFFQLNRVMKKDGIVGFIANCKGTLEDIEKIFLETMVESPENIAKIMDIKFSIPSSVNSITKGLSQYGFEIHSSGEAEELVTWLYETGAIAGTKEIFKDGNKAIKTIVEKVKKYKKQGESFCINHRFIYGVYKRSVSKIKKRKVYDCKKYNCFIKNDI